MKLPLECKAAECRGFDWIDGVAVGLAGSLFSKKCLEEEDWGLIAKIAKDLIDALKL
jgi:2-keto-3-deoxy-6-phosphogluconate aldolase